MKARSRFRFAGPFLALPLLICSAQSLAFDMYAATSSNALVHFFSQTPEVTSSIPITGLGAGESVVGLDFRPRDQNLYALTKDGVGAGRLYVLNPFIGVATLVGPSAFTLSGSKFGMNFNPTVDRLRVVSDTGQNIRINPSTGTLAATDVALNPGTPHVVAIAYTNSYGGATSTTLYDIDSDADAMLIQTNPNGGILAAVGDLGFDTSDAVGFDIVAFGSGNVAYATLTVGGVVGLYTMVLETGTAGFVGNVIGNPAIIALTIFPEIIFKNGFD